MALRIGGRVERLIGGGGAPCPGTGGGGDIDEREGGGDMDGRAEMLERGAGGGGGGCLLYGSQFVFLRGTLISLSTSSPKIRNTDIPRVSYPGYSASWSR